MDRKPTALFFSAVFLFVFATLSVGDTSAPVQDTLAPGTSTAAIPSAARVRSTVDILNIRALPGLEGRLVGRLLPDQAVLVLGTGEKWLKIEKADGTTGYIFRAYTTAAPEVSVPDAMETETRTAGSNETTPAAGGEPAAVAAENHTLRPLSNLHLARIAGQGLSTDMTQAELDRVVGRGLISALTPEEIAAIDAQGIITLEESVLKTRDLERIIAQGVTFVVDKSKIPPEDLEKIQGQGTVADIGRAPFSVQVGVYKIRENAISMLSDLKTKGYNPYIFQTVGDTGETLYAVRIGDYESLQDAYAVTTHFQSKENKPAIVTYINSLKTVSVEDMQPAGTAVPVVAPVPKPSRAYEGDLGDLYAEMQLLREEVERLRTEGEAREMLRITETEAKREEEEILSAADRQYVMSPEGTLNLDYTFGYSYNTYDIANWTVPRLEHTANHSISNTVAAGYSFADNFRAHVSVPFVYKYHEIGQADSKSVTDIGDVSLGANWQPFRTGGDVPAMIFLANATIPTGRSPYEINPQEDLSTGSGLYSLSLGVSGSKKLDPVVAFGGFGYTYALEESGLNQNLFSTKTLSKVQPSGALAMNMGLGYAMSYKASIHASVAYAYILNTTYHYTDGTSSETGTAAAASLSLGTGWKVSSKRTISVNLGIGLTNDAPDFSFSFRIPFDYEL